MREFIYAVSSQNNFRKQLILNANTSANILHKTVDILSEGVGRAHNRMVHINVVT